MVEVKEDRQAFTTLFYLIDKINRDNAAVTDEEGERMLQKFIILKRGLNDKEGYFVVGDKSYRVSKYFQKFASQMVQVMTKYKIAANKAVKEGKI